MAIAQMSQGRTSRSRLRLTCTSSSTSIATDASYDGAGTSSRNVARCAASPPTSGTKGSAPTNGAALRISISQSAGTDAALPNVPSAHAINADGQRYQAFDARHQLPLQELGLEPAGQIGDRLLEITTPSVRHAIPHSHDINISPTLTVFQARVDRNPPPRPDCAQG